MAAQANNPFGMPPAQALHHPFTAPSSGQPAPSFGMPAQNPFGAPASNTFGGAPASNPFGNPFGAPSAQASVFGAPPSPTTQNPFGKPPPQAQLGNFFAPAQSTAQPPSAPRGPSIFGAADVNAMARQSKFPGSAAPVPNNNGFGGRGQNMASQQSSPFANSKPSTKQPSGFAAEAFEKRQADGRNKKPAQQERHQPLPRTTGIKTAPIREPSERTKQLSPFAFNYANKLYNHLKKEKINPPQPLADAGDPSKRGAVESLKETYKKKADLVDDPDKRRKLEDALPFKGICEDMCPETEEKETRPDGLTMWPDTSRMVKKFGRSAAGQDAPLPMDVRSVDALRRTTDYLFNDLLQSDNNLPSMHNFLWDRTRAVRKDFTFHSQKSGDELKDMVYCFETITRFHATSLHLLSRKGFANEDFDQKQEIEQLGRTILSLMEAYDMCRDKRVQCENEAEFRAIPTWGKEYWFESEEVQTALSLIQAMDDVREPKGPIKPRRPTTLSDMSFANYFAIVQESRIHFTTVRQAILRNLVRGYARHRDAPRTITASDLNAMLKFDTDEEAVEFAELHDFEFSSWVPDGKPAVPEPYLLLNNRKKYVPSPRVRQSFSGKLVERKRTTQSLPFVIYNTIFEEATEALPGAENSPDSLFVSQASPFGGTPSPNPSAFMQPAAPPPPPTPTPFTNTTPPTGPRGTAVPAFGNSQPAQPTSSTIPSPFGAPSQPAAQAQPVKSPFSFQAQAPASSATVASSSQPSSILGQPAQFGQATASPFAASKPSETSSTFAFLKNFGSAQASATQTMQPSAAVASTPSHASSTQAKPAQQAMSFPKPGASLPGGTSPFSSTASEKPTEAQPTPAAPSPATPITLPTPPASSTQIPQQIPPPSALAPQKSSPFTLGGPAAAPPKPPKPQQPKRDLMADFTNWFVKGDGGLMEQFTESALHDMLWNVFQDVQRQKAEQKRREEDEESWRVAREHQTYRLQVKYFYRWRNTARTLATKRILRSGKEKMRAYREQQRVALKQQQEAQEKAEREARRAHKRQLLDDGRRLSLLASSQHRRPSLTYSVDHNPEEQLLASGVLAGLRDDPRAVARRIVRDAVANGDNWGSATSVSRSGRYPYPESELELEPARDSPEDTSSSAGRREGWKTRSLREKFGLGEPRAGRSFSASGNSPAAANGVSSSFRQSLPGSRNTNFSSTTMSPPAAAAAAAAAGRKRGADEESDEEPGAKRGTAAAGGLARSRHWDLRARGFVLTPRGGWVPEAIARGSGSSSCPCPSPYSHSHSHSPSRASPRRGLDRDGGSGDGSGSEASGLRARLARLRQARGPVVAAKLALASGVDLAMASAGAGTVSAGRSCPPPPPPPARLGRRDGADGNGNGGKRKRGGEADGMVDGDDGGGGLESEALSPGGRKKVNVGDAAPGREETSAMVENTRRMLRELREFMDRLDGEGQEN
ncbi:hypothetical protein BT67DRAFT_447659 [Trichocladium antarcticum]|uniref:SAC3/GANP/THP3 conserved domain-containing protein n=1 Tax=Trichocladium antarcticum TaxID=1450529 RepID=A0AAN6ZGX1_9PEZI|nr:hypothetical protein BT67DRAFT_447659 [Trichocladium antarcticum]